MNDICFALHHLGVCKPNEFKIIYRYLRSELVALPKNLERQLEKAVRFVSENQQLLKEIKQNYTILLPHQLPQKVQEIGQAPHILYCRGNIDLLQASHCIALVGTRQMTQTARQNIARLFAYLEGKNVIIVSGGAFGVDAEVTQLAINVGIPVVTVFASGLAQPSPTTNIRLFDQQLANGGLWLSEQPLNKSATKYSFPERNRIISALAQVTIVIEAPLKSGALITAEFALNQNRDVLAIPGSLDQYYSQGCNKLIATASAGLLYDFNQLEQYIGTKM